MGVLALTRDDGVVEVLMFGVERRRNVLVSKATTPLGAAPGEGG